MEKMNTPKNLKEREHLKRDMAEMHKRVSDSIKEILILEKEKYSKREILGLENYICICEAKIALFKFLLKK